MLFRSLTIGQGLVSQAKGGAPLLYERDVSVINLVVMLDLSVILIGVTMIVLKAIFEFRVTFWGRVVFQVINIACGRVNLSVT